MCASFASDTIPIDSLEVSGPWKRWSRYELVGGAITPAAGAKLGEWDPWKGFRANVGKYRTVEQPYVVLLELRRQLQDVEERTGALPTQRSEGKSLDRPKVPSAPADELIREWCNMHGLLGLLPVLCSRMQLAGQIREREEPESVQIDWVQYFRDGGDWRAHTDSEGESGPGANDYAERRIGAAKATVTWVRAITHARYEDPFEALKDFFPRLEAGQTTFIPPQPQTAAFWNAYGEPVSEFAQHLDLFGHAVDTMSGWPGEETPPPQRQAVNNAFGYLTALAQAAAHSFEHDLTSSRTTGRMQSAGLIASYARMFLLDHEAGRRCRRCQKCGRYFVSDERRSRYCSSRCRHTAQSRRHRAKVAGASN